MLRQAAADREGELDERPGQGPPQSAPALLELRGHALQDPDDRTDPVFDRRVLTDHVGGEADRPDVDHRILVEVRRLPKVEERALQEEAQEEPVDPARFGETRIVEPAQLSE